MVEQRSGECHKEQGNHLLLHRVKGRTVQEETRYLMLYIKLLKNIPIIMGLRQKYGFHHPTSSTAKNDLTPSFVKDLKRVTHSPDLIP
jgi:hypothetical protein